MTPVERLEAAITKLETLKAESTPGRWEAEEEAFNGWTVRAWMDNEFNGNTAIAIARHGSFDAFLIVTLHRTIDAQLAILRREYKECSISFGGMYSLPDPEAVSLANAILGGA